jgi:hypothetical protein
MLTAFGEAISKDDPGRIAGRLMGWKSNSSWPGFAPLFPLVPLDEFHCAPGHSRFMLL